MDAVLLSLAPCKISPRRSLIAAAKVSPRRSVTAAEVSPRRSVTAAEVSPRRSVISTAKTTSVTYSYSSSSSSFRKAIVRCCMDSSSPSPSLEKFKEAIVQGKNLVPLYKLIFSDQLTPVLAYRCLVNEDGREAPPSFLFESVDMEQEATGRYSVIGSNPCIEVVAKENLVTVLDHHEGQSVQTMEEDPMLIPRRLMDKWKPHLLDELPEAFTGGWFGYFSYDMVRYVEKKKLSFSNGPLDDRFLPDLHLSLYDSVVVLDHLHERAYIIQWVRLDNFHSVEEAYKDGVNRLEALVAKLQNRPRLSVGSMELHTNLCPQKKMSTVTDDEYQKAVLLAKDHILIGDIFQMVLSRRFERKTLAHPFDIYRALRTVNPSPYLRYLQCRGCILVSSSPQIFTKVQRGKITVRPLAGTIRRGRTSAEDNELENELLSNEKACAEHIMLVDLARNDVGKISRYGSVNVEKLMAIEKYSHVMHISSTVTGELCDNLSSWDVLRAALPAGTVTGAPKVKAMELIDKLEATRRGPYSGAFGGISFSGDMDLALTLTTIIFPIGLHRGWIAHIQAGTGIVADSNPVEEQIECESKTAALFSAIHVAESSFLKN